MAQKPQKRELISRQALIRDMISELRGIVNLKDKDHKAYFESSKAGQKRNRDRIIRLFKDNQHLLSLQKNAICDDKEIIEIAFCNHPAEAKVVHGRTVEYTIDYLNQKVFDLNKRYDLAKSLLKRKDCKVKEIKGAISRVLKESRPFEQEQMIRWLETNLEKTQVKIDAARNIQHEYKSIIRKLKSEALKYPQELDLYEDTIINHEKQIQNLHEMVDDSKTAQTFSEKEVDALEHVTRDARNKREMTTSNLKKTIETLREELIEISVKRRTTSQTGVPKFINVQKGFQKRFIPMGRRQQVQKLMNYEDMFERLMNVTQVTEVTQVLPQIAKQKEAAINLSEEKVRLEKYKEDLVKDLSNMETELEILKYKENADVELVNGKVKEYQRMLDKDNLQYEEIKVEAKAVGTVLVQVGKIVDSIVQKLKHVILDKPDEERAKTGDTVDVLMACQKRVAKLKEKIDQESSNIEPAVMAQLQEKIQKYMEKSTPPELVRIKLPLPSAISEDFEREVFDNEDYLSRDNLKRIAQRMLDSRLKKGRRGRKK